MNMEWISVNERLPETYGEYIVFVKNLTGQIFLEKSIFVANYFYKQWLFEGWVDNKVTHWMPLPEPPKE